MPDKTAKTPLGQLIFRIALIGMVLAAIGAGIGLARRAPSQPPATDASAP